MAFGGVKVLHNVTTSVEGPGIVALVGPNGAGKTTLFNIVTGALKPGSGSVQAFGIELTALSAEEIADLGVFRTFQDVRLFRDLSVRENICVGLRRALRRRDTLAKVDEVMEHFQLADQADCLARDLSYGASKLLSVARTVIHEPKLLLLDEPASGMDAQSYECLTRAVQDLEDIPMVIVEHNLDVVRGLASRVIFLDGGEILADGSTAEILAREDLASIYFGRAAGARRGTQSEADG
ncbi:ABC transporter ATP-binding protein [Conexibacter sp. S30A1]|uniref:ABC transporter ATP-binding protein n=1 Tax=Conexibacter sp. S30A1 TaxID=2937800 RepID=UPI00200C499C|nr:ATP-binding cassette domain-containing protein [Conexibacter sp. S30A1]